MVNSVLLDGSHACSRMTLEWAGRLLSARFEATRRSRHAKMEAYGWRGMQRDAFLKLGHWAGATGGCAGCPSLSKGARLHSCAISRRRSGCACRRICEGFRVFSINNTLFYSELHASTRRRRSIIYCFPRTAGWDEGSLYAPREGGHDAGEDAAPVLCRRQHAKALPGCHREERWAVSGPQRGITCTKAFSPPGSPKPPAKDTPRARRRRPRTLLWLSNGPVWSCGCPATPALRSKSWWPATN